MTRPVLQLLLAILPIGIPPARDADAAETKPNIVVILADELDAAFI